MTSGRHQQVVNDNRGGGMIGVVLGGWFLHMACRALTTPAATATTHIITVPRAFREQPHHRHTPLTHGGCYYVDP